MSKKTVLFGAGQIGAMVSRLLGGEYSIIGFADNFEKKCGTTLLGIPIRSVTDSLQLAPDCICLCVLDEERSSAMEHQLHDLGYTGELLRPDLLRSFDARVATMRLLAEQIHQEGIRGDTAELGVFRGAFAALISLALPDRRIHLFDTFEGFTETDIAIEVINGYSRARIGDFSDTSIESVRSCLPYPELAEFHPGYFPGTFVGCEEEMFSLVSIDADLYAPTAAALPLFYDRLSPGGAILVHDVNSTQFTGAAKAVDEFCKERHILPTPICDLHGSVILRKPI